MNKLEQIISDLHLFNQQNIDKDITLNALNTVKNIVTNMMCDIEIIKSDIYDYLKSTYFDQINKKFDSINHCSVVIEHENIMKKPIVIDTDIPKKKIIKPIKKQFGIVYENTGEIEDSDKESDKNTPTSKTKTKNKNLILDIHQPFSSYGTHHKKRSAKNNDKKENNMIPTDADSDNDNANDNVDKSKEYVSFENDGNIYYILISNNGESKYEIFNENNKLCGELIEDEIKLIKDDSTFTTIKLKKNTGQNADGRILFGNYLL